MGVRTIAYHTKQCDVKEIALVLTAHSVFDGTF